MSKTDAINRIAEHYFQEEDDHPAAELQNVASVRHGYGGNNHRWYLYVGGTDLLWGRDG